MGRVVVAITLAFALSGGMALPHVEGDSESGDAGRQQVLGRARQVRVWRCGVMDRDPAGDLSRARVALALELLTLANAEIRCAVNGTEADAVWRQGVKFDVDFAAERVAELGGLVRRQAHAGH